MPKRLPWVLILSCEHGGNKIPREYRRFLCREDARDLRGHRGWDIGALALARHLKRAFSCTLYAAQVSRLLVDLNRSSHHRACLGASFRSWEKEAKHQIFEAYYWPYREGLTAEVQRNIKAKKRVIHLSIHSFTPVLGGDVRRSDISLLYDPQRRWERMIVDHWIPLLGDKAPNFDIRRNYPYRGTADGCTRSLRQSFPGDHYAGIEIEVNQKHLLSSAGSHRLGRILEASLQQLFDCSL